MSMRTVKIILGLAVLIFVSIAGWQIGACEVANIRLRDDMEDLASQSGVRIGLTTARSDDDFRNAVLGKARQYDIELAPDQVRCSAQAPALQERYQLGLTTRCRYICPASPSHCTSHLKRGEIL
jgi:hypothetical protein